MSQPSMIDLMDENDVREALKQVVEDVERKRKEIAKLVEMLERVEKNAVMPDTTWQALDKLINKHKE